MVHKVIVTGRAHKQFLTICNYLAEEFGERTADGFETEVDNCINMLRKFPESGHRIHRAQIHLSVKNCWQIQQNVLCHKRKYSVFVSFYRYENET